MDREEIKSRYSMRDIIGRYGFHPNHSGFIPCPFHKEKTASMKIYPDSYYCFGCGEHGDIFSFIMDMENQTFREVFLSLGGTYKEETYRDKIAKYHAVKEQEQRKKKRMIHERKRKDNQVLIDIYRDGYQRSQPFSEAWADCYHALQYQLYLHEILNQQEGQWSAE